MKFFKFYILTLFLVSGLGATAEAQPGDEAGPATGTVVETMVSGGYLYMKLEEQGIWIATSPLPEPVAVGDQVEYTGGMEMRNFQRFSQARSGHWARES